MVCVQVVNTYHSKAKQLSGCKRSPIPTRVLEQTADGQTTRITKVSNGGVVQTIMASRIANRPCATRLRNQAATAVKSGCHATTKITLGYFASSKKYHPTPTAL